jgi:hypothetical protein
LLILIVGHDWIFGYLCARRIVAAVVACNHCYERYGSSVASENVYEEENR